MDPPNVKIKHHNNVEKHKNRNQEKGSARDTKSRE